MRRILALVGLAAILTFLLAPRVFPAVAGTRDPRWPQGVVNVYDDERHDRHHDHRRRALDRLGRERHDPRRPLREATPT